MTDSWEASFGDINLSPWAQGIGDVDVTVYGLRRGKHTRITAVADSLIQDGSIERVVRDDNRDVQLVLCLDGSDSEALAQYEATLFREVNKGRNEFRWTPPDGFGATAVFDVLWADLAFADEDTVWDLDEIRGRRNYVLTLRCLPFARSVDPFTVAGLTSGAAASTTVIDDASSAAAWSATDGGATATSAGGVVSLPMVVEARYGSKWAPSSSRRLRRAGSTAIPVGSYVYVDWRFESDGQTSPDIAVNLYIDGSYISPVGNSGVAPATGYIRSIFHLPNGDASATNIEMGLEGFVTSASQPGSFTLRVTEIGFTNQAPSVGTLRQKISKLDIPGSARTPASLVVSHPSSNLGNVLVYTGASKRPGYAPPLSPYRVGATETENTYVSGRRFNASTETFDVPVANLNAGLHQLVMRAKSGTYSATATLRVGGVNVGVAISGSPSAELLADDGTGLAIYTLGALVLPPHEVPDTSTAVVRVQVTQSSGVATYPIDEVWAFYMPDDGTAHLSAIPAATARRVTLAAATVDLPHPSCHVGTATDGSDAYAVSGVSSNWDEHVVTAGMNDAFTVTTVALDAAVAATGHARWLTHPAA